MLTSYITFRLTIKSKRREERNDGLLKRSQNRAAILFANSGTRITVVSIDTQNDGDDAIEA
jgi:hypothetical protein